MSRRTASLVVLSLASAVAVAPATHADSKPSPETTASSFSSTWVVPGDVPFPDWARSVLIIRDDEALQIAPAGARRGLVALGVRLPLLGAIRGPGCIGRWLLVGPLAYVCSDKVQFSGDAPAVPDMIHPPPEGGLPYRYYFVGAEGADSYAKLADYEDETPIEQLDKGWAVAAVGEVTYKGTTFVKTRKNYFIAKKQLGPVAGSGFHGEPLSLEPGVAPNVGFVMPDKANVYADAKASSKSVGARTRLQKVDVLETKKVGTGGKDTWHRIGDAQWMRAQDLRVPTLAPPPDGLLPDERWIDVDTMNQTLVAYEGTRAVFATVISTGRQPGSTPKGTFRIWVKLRSTTMSNADDAVDTTEEAATYSIEDVPWVQFFSNGVALHGTFWHRQFGRVHSHGCVNLSPLDALRMFEWTGPRLPKGWDAVFPTTAEPATIVKVR